MWHCSKLNTEADRRTQLSVVSEITKGLENMKNNATLLIKSFCLGHYIYILLKYAIYVHFNRFIILIF